MIYKDLNEEHKTQYETYLQIIGSVSELFSTSDIPYLYYRIAEKIYCLSFEAKDLSRGDISIDAKLNHLGIGLKTFLRNNNKTFQKIAEFNKDQALYNMLPPKQAIHEISTLRNQRLSFAKKQTDVEKLLYHCVVRDKGTFYIYEENMDFIDIPSLILKKDTKNTLLFHDKWNEYSFNFSKSTLLKRFKTDHFYHKIDINILDNPLKHLQDLLQNKNLKTPSSQNFIFLPLYSYSHLKGRFIPEKSGLNQWNASGRSRNYNEIYIPIRSEIHKLKPHFFPPRDTKFFLTLPNSSRISCKLCQDGMKALMSDPNKDLGIWLLRDVLNIPEGELLTIETLERLGIDSVRIDKIKDTDYEIHFSGLYSYEDFINNIQ